MIRKGSENVADRRKLVESDVGRDPYASRAIRISKDAVEVDLTLQSDNFVPGPSGSGWQLDRETGNLEANDGTFRGTLDSDSGSFGGTLDAASGSFEGTVVAGGGTVRLDSAGIRILSGSSTTNNVRWVDSFGGAVEGSIGVGGTGVVTIDAFNGISLSTANWIQLACGTDITLTSPGDIDIESGTGAWDGIQLSGYKVNVSPGAGKFRYDGTEVAKRGGRTTISLDWSATGGNGTTSSVNPYPGSGSTDFSHTHEVPYHTHSIYI